MVGVAVMLGDPHMLRRERVLVDWSCYFGVRQDYRLL